MWVDKRTPIVYHFYFGGSQVGLNLKNHQQINLQCFHDINLKSYEARLNTGLRNKFRNVAILKEICLQAVTKADQAPMVSG